MYREKMFGISLYRSGANHVKQVRDKDQGRGKGFRQMCVSFKPASHQAAVASCLRVSSLPGCLTHLGG